MGLGRAPLVPFWFDTGRWIWLRRPANGTVPRIDLPQCQYDSVPPRVRPNDRIFTVIVGPESHQYEMDLHADFICAASRFFEGVVENQGRFGAPTNIIRLADMDPVVFTGFCDWLYGRELGETAQLANAGQIPIPMSWDKYLFEIYCLADRLMCPGLQLHLWMAIKGLMTAAYDETIKPFKPSDELFRALFDGSRDLRLAAKAVQRHVIGHIFHWACPLASQHNDLGPWLPQDWASMEDNLNNAVTNEVPGLPDSIYRQTFRDMLARASSSNDLVLHPRDWYAQAEIDDGCNSAELERETRARDKFTRWSVWAVRPLWTHNVCGPIGTPKRVVAGEGNTAKASRQDN